MRPRRRKDTSRRRNDAGTTREDARNRSAASERRDAATEALAVYALDEFGGDATARATTTRDAGGDDARDARRFERADETRERRKGDARDDVARGRGSARADGDVGVVDDAENARGDATVERKLAGVVRLDGGRQLARRRIAGNASTSDRVDVRSRARRCVR